MSSRYRGYICMFGLLLLSDPRPISAEGETAQPVTLNVGFGPTSFLNVNLADAKAAFKVFTETVGKEKGYDLNVIVEAYENGEEFTSAVANGHLHLVVMLAWTFMSSGLDNYLEPHFLAVESDIGPQEYMLMVPTDSPYQGISDLRGKHVTILVSSNCEMSQYWARTLLLEHGLGTEEEFFARVEVEAKPAKVVLPVFFGNVDACVVSRPILETMCEMNPQIGRRLRSIAVSEPLADAVTFLAYEGWLSAQHREDMIEALGNLHETPHGKQILTLFKVDHMAPFEEWFLEGTYELKTKYDRLLSQMEKR